MKSFGSSFFTSAAGAADLVSVAAAPADCGGDEGVSAGFEFELPQTPWTAQTEIERDLAACRRTMTSLQLLTRRGERGIR